jgi:hypothetical protein
LTADGYWKLKKTAAKIVFELWVTCAYLYSFSRQRDGETFVLFSVKSTSGRKNQIYFSNLPQ